MYFYRLEIYCVDIYIIYRLQLQQINLKSISHLKLKKNIFSTIIYVFFLWNLIMKPLAMFINEMTAHLSPAVGGNISFILKVLNEVKPRMLHLVFFVSVIPLAISHLILVSFQKWQGGSLWVAIPSESIV